MPAALDFLFETRALPTVALLLAGGLGLSGCASQAKVSSAWADGAQRGQAFTRVLVVGVSPDIDQRCPFERMLAGRLTSPATAAFASCDVVAQKNPLTRESIEAAIAAKQADAVVATSLVSREWELQQGGTRDTRGGGMYKATDSGWATGYYGVYGVPVIYGEFQTAPPALTVQGEIRLTSRVFDTRVPKLVYTMETTARDIETRDQGAHELTMAISERLRKDGLVR
jgi:hypothetical protein